MDKSKIAVGLWLSSASLKWGLDMPIAHPADPNRQTSITSG